VETSSLLERSLSLRSNVNVLSLGTGGARSPAQLDGLSETLAMAYHHIKEIGRGSFGKVDLVEDEEGGRWAKKTFIPQTLPGITSDELQERFEREVRYQREIEHDNVVAIEDFDLDDDPPWFIMQLADTSHQ
jgi:serine/threonine protein kinase